MSGSAGPAAPTAVPSVRARRARGAPSLQDAAQQNAEQNGLFGNGQNAEQNGLFGTGQQNANPFGRLFGQQTASVRATDAEPMTILLSSGGSVHVPGPGARGG